MALVAYGSSGESDTDGEETEIEIQNGTDITSNSKIDVTKQDAVLDQKSAGKLYCYTSVNL